MRPVIYFDNAASTEPLDEVLRVYTRAAKEIYGNPSSLHGYGVAAENEIKGAASSIAELLGVSPDELVFTSGGTESNNQAISGAASRARKSANFVTTAAEHPSVSECFAALKKNNLTVKVVETGADGRVDPVRLLEAVDGDTALVSVVHINNETGAVNQIREIGAAIKRADKNILFHVDGVQSFGKYRVDLYGSGVDLFSFSAHKIHGLKGVGCLFVKNGTRLSPLLYGGGQQRELRPGTENAAGITAFAEASRVAYRDMDKNFKIAASVRDVLLKITGRDGAAVNGDLKNGSPYILNMSFAGHKGEIILNALSGEGIYVSTGSACNGRRGKQNALVKMGVTAERAESAVRFSFSRFNTIGEAAECVGALDKILDRF